MAPSNEIVVFFVIGWPPPMKLDEGGLSIDIIIVLTWIGYPTVHTWHSAPNMWSRQ